MAIFNSILTVGQLIDDLSHFNNDAVVNCYVNTVNGDDEEWDKLGDVEVLGIDQAVGSDCCEIIAVRDNSDVIKAITNTLVYAPDDTPQQIIEHIKAIKKLLPEVKLDELPLKALYETCSEYQYRLLF